MPEEFWNETTMAALRSHWASGISTAEIGRKMGITKNAVVGKAHRMELIRRPSPILRSSPPPSPKPRKKPARPAPVLTPDPSLDASGATVDLTALADSQPVHAPVPVTPKVVARVMPPCCWPIGNPGSPSFRFCEVPAIEGKPYCEAHADLAYVKTQNRREDRAEMARIARIADRSYASLKAA